jgi:hypothetical protein
MTVTALMLGPLTGQPIITTDTTPLLGSYNVYNTVLGGGDTAMTIPLPLVGSQTIGAYMTIEKDVNDTTLNTLTFNCYLTDTFVDGTTSLTITQGGGYTIAVVSISGVSYWKVVGTVGVSTASSSTTEVVSEDDVDAFGDNPDDDPMVIVTDQGLVFPDLTRFGERLPTGTGYGRYGEEGLYGYGY